MGADDDIHRAIGQPLPGECGLFGADEPRQRPDAQRGAAETFGKGLEMLAGQQRGRGDDRHLLARNRRDKGRAHRHLGLAKAHVADNQPIHRRARPEIGDHIGNRRQLVFGFAIGKTGREGFPFVVGGLENRGGAQVPFGGNPHQPVGDLADAFLQPCLLGLPGAAAQLVQQPLFMAVSAEQFDILDRQVKPVTARIFQKHAVMRRPQRGDGF